MFGGGIVPVCTLRITFSQTSALAPGFAMSTRSSMRPAVFTRSLWHVTQYLSISWRWLDGAWGLATDRGLVCCAEVSA